MTGRKFSFEVRATSSASAATLFRLETDGANWKNWAQPLVLQSSWLRQGEPAPGGIGAIRKVGAGPMMVQEETIAYEQDRRHAYRLIKPATALKDYVGEFELFPNFTGGTDVVWRGSFVESLPGTGPIVCAALRSSIKLFAGKLIKAAEQQS